jgi:adenine-specific DNA-methyltransferase
MQGNSLIEEYEGIKLFDEELLKFKSEENHNQIDLFQQEKIKLEQGNLFKYEDLTSSFELKVKKENLHELIQKYIETHARTAKQALKQHIDNLKWQLIEGTLIEQGKDEKIADIIKFRKKNVKPFFIWKLEFNDVFQEKGGFDIVIGNPPYVGESGNKEIFRPIAKGNLGKFYQGKMDLFYFFFHLALDLGKNNAECAFITTNYFLTAFGAKKMRADLKDRSIINNLINFNELKIFESALGQHNMITIFSKGQSSEKLAHNAFTKRDGVANEKVLSEIVKNLDKFTEYNQIPQKELYDGAEAYIRLNGTNNQNDPIQKILNKIQKESDTLDSVCNVNQGVVSGCDYVSGRNTEKLEDKTGIEKNDGIFVFDLHNLRDLETLDSFNEDEKKLLRPFFKNSDIGRYWCEIKEQKLLLYLGKTRSDISSYPNIQKHLSRFRNILNDRREVQNGRIKYHQLQWYRTEDIFMGNKLVVPYRTTSNTFAINNQEWFCRSDCYVITEKTNECDLKFILGILNSKLYFQWLYHRGKRKGEILELFQAPLSEIPIKKISPSEQQPFINLVDRIFAITSFANYDPKNPPVEQIDLEKQIDQMVYQLYGLTEEEIRIVESAIAPKVGKVVEEIVDISDGENNE